MYFTGAVTVAVIYIRYNVHLRANSKLSQNLVKTDLVKTRQKTVINKTNTIQLQMLPIICVRSIRNFPIVFHSFLVLFLSLNCMYFEQMFRVTKTVHEFLLRLPIVCGFNNAAMHTVLQ